MGLQIRQKLSSLGPIFAFDAPSQTASQRMQQGQAQRPFAMAGFHIDVASLLQTDKFTAPGPCIGTGQPDGAKGVVAAGHQHAAVRQAGIGNRREVVQHRAALGVGRGHQQRTLDTLRHLGRDMRGGDAAQAVRRNHHRPRGSQDGALQRSHPGRARRGDPVVLHHPHGVRQALSPQALPVAGAGVAPARNDDESHKYTPSLRALRVASPTPLQGATPVARQSRFHGVSRSASVRIKVAATYLLGCGVIRR